MKIETMYMNIEHNDNEKVIEIEEEDLYNGVDNLIEAGLDKDLAEKVREETISKVREKNKEMNKNWGEDAIIGYANIVINTIVEELKEEEDLDFY